jgi:Flp pilus assembly protein protease CpaA
VPFSLGRLVGSLALTQDVLLAVFAVTVMATDWLRQRIYNVVTYPTMALGLVLAAVEGFPGEVLKGGLLDHLVATVGILIVFYPMYSPGWVKAGDVKLLMAVGALKGVVFLFWSLVYGAILGGLVAIAYLAWAALRARDLRAGLGKFIPYGVSLAAGSLVALFAGVAR